MNFKISPLSKWILSTGLIYLALVTILRICFFEYFRTTGNTFSGFTDAFLLGLRYDLRLVCAILLPVFIVANLKLEDKNNKLTPKSKLLLIGSFLLSILIIFFLKNNKASIISLVLVGVLIATIFLGLFIKKDYNPFKNKNVKKIWRIYFLLATIFIVFFYAVDFQHFDYLGQRLNASVINYTQDTKISLSMVWQTYPVIRMLLSMVAVVFVINWLIIKSFTNISVDATKNYYFSILLFLLLAFGIWGKVSQFPLRWSDAFAFGNDFKSSVALNPVQSFFSSLQFRDAGYNITEVKKYYPFVANYLGVKNADSNRLNYTRRYTYPETNSKQNVVLVLCESFSGYKSSMWGNPLNTTPYFEQLSKQGIFFDRCFSPSYGTARGVWATITGVPDVEIANTASRNPSAVDQHTIINDFTGYEKLYFLGGSTSWANIRGLLTNNIKDLKLFEEGSYKAEAIDVWGISDKHLFLEANEILKQQTSPFFAVIQTADNHRPYTIPKEDLEEFSKREFPKDSLKKYGFESNAELNAFRYADFCYRKFMEAAKKEKYFANTLFVFVGDHGIRGDAGNMFPKAWTENGLTTTHVPLLFYSPATLSPARINASCSQIDILPTIASMLKISHTNTTLGRNLFDTIQTTSIPFTATAFLFDPDEKKIGMITDEYLFQSNFATGKEVFVSSKNNDPLPSSPAIIQQKKQLQDITKAYYETAKYMILNNKKAVKR